MAQQIKVVRKHQRKSALDDNKTLMQVGEKASRKAIKEALESGVSVTYIQNGRLIRLDPNGTIVVLKRTENRDAVTLRDLLCRT